MAGIEIYNASHDALEESRLRMALWTIMVPQDPFYFSLLDRPYDPLDRWDKLIAQFGRLTGTGGADAHEYRAMGLKFAPYEVMFRFVRNHVLVPSRQLSPEHIYEALRAGHTYVSFELLAEARGFTFNAQEKDKTVAIMGDEVAFRPNLSLVTSLPAVGQMTLMKDGQPVDSKIGNNWTIKLEAPGIYRLEVTRHNKPWIYSNPIYVRFQEKAEETQAPSQTQTAMLNP